LELELGSTEGVFECLGVCSLNHILSHLVGKSSQDFGLILGIVHKEVHLAELVVKRNSLGKREHATLWEQFFGCSFFFLAKAVCDANWERVVFLNNEG